VQATIIFYVFYVSANVIQQLKQLLAPTIRQYMQGIKSVAKL